MRAYGVSHIGLVRKVNEDSYYYQNKYEYGKPYLCIVADGMGGHNAGEIASRMAVSEVKDFVEKAVKKSNDYKIEDYKKLVTDAFLFANEKVYKRSIENRTLSGMGTTLTLALIIKNNLVIGHVGDSRMYLIKDRRISKITEDHSYVAELIKNGTIKPEEAIHHPQKNLITRALGTSKDLQVDVKNITINDGDFILICTDGLSNMLSDKEILDTIISVKEYKAICHELINKANLNGGLDNVTVVVIEVQLGGEAHDR
ncbi:MAG: Stp1/IreP family PP2C-type Ser/Thr phosphatase [Clostridiales bacterium]|nr:Stp1/IreP family PP2C-type Ser/Thr phosphatase [Clostridiales bacterium]